MVFGNAKLVNGYFRQINTCQLENGGQSIWSGQCMVTLTQKNGYQKLDSGHLELINDQTGD